MSTSRHITIWCDLAGCDEWLDLGDDTVTQARKRAKTFGWRVGVPDRTRRPCNNSRLDFCSREHQQEATR
jgi:hypothetical protein